MSVSTAAKAFLEALDSNNTTSAYENEKRMELVEALAAVEAKPKSKPRVRKPKPADKAKA